MRYVVLLALAVFVAAPTVALSAERIGLAVPLSGRQAPVGDRVEFGAFMELEDARADGKTVELVLADTGCTAEGALAASEQLKAAEVEIVIGPLCTEAAIALAGAMEDVPVLSLDTRNPLLARQREFDSLPLFELGHAPDAEARAIVDLVLPRFAGRPYALLDDGSVPMRALSDTLLLRADEAGLRPTQIANFRPLQSTYRTLLRRLGRSGIEALVVLAAPEDVVTIARDMQALGLEWEIGTGESGRLLPYNDPPLPQGMTVISVQPADPPPSNIAGLAERLLTAKANVEDALVSGYAAAQVAVAFEPETPLVNQSFDTIMGPVAFDANGRATPLSFRLVETTGPPETPAGE